MLRKLTVSFLIFVISVLSGAVWLVGCSVISGPQPSPSAQERLEKLNLSLLPVQEQVVIRWDTHAIPYIEARSDQDGFLALGFVHAHLRLGQMELLRRAVSGRLSELVGPFANDLDATLKVVGIDDTAHEIVDALSAQEKLLVESFAAGINTYINTTPILPFEFAAFNLTAEPWTPQDVVRVSRLASIDFSWIMYLSLLKVEDKAAREELWQKIQEMRQELGKVEYPQNSTLSALVNLFSATGRTGSNSAVVAGFRTESGKPLIMSDPHLGVSIPNFWLLAALKSPSFHVAGLMIPGTPFFALGRNPHAAWGGTNLRAISSHLYRASEKTLAEATEITEEIPTRWWFDSEVTWRRTPLGPVLTDAPIFPQGEPVVLNWLGHRSDGREFSAFLNLARVKSWKDFQSTFSGYLVPGLSMLYAGADGDIGALSAYSQPLPEQGQFFNLIKEATEASPLKFRKQEEFPVLHNPEEGFIVSANNELKPSEPPVSFMPPLPSRRKRLEELLTGSFPLSIDEAIAIQSDTLSLSSLQLRGVLLPRLQEVNDLSSHGQRVVDSLARWDGRYGVESRGAVAFEHLSYNLLQELFRLQKLGEQEQRLWRRGYWKSALARELENLALFSEEQLRTQVENTAAYLNDGKTWGDVHRHLLQYPLGNVPVIGSRYQFVDVPAPGTTDTIYKAGGEFAPEGVTVPYGSQARHISNLADINENYFVLLGGQDGWLVSPQTLDQVELWRESKYVKVPLEFSELVEPFTTVLNPE